MFSRITSLIATLLVAATFSGCTNQSRESIPSSYTLQPDTKKGLLIASLTYHGTYSAYRIMYRKSGSDQWEYLQIGSSSAVLPPGMQHWDIEEPGLRGQVFVIELPAGDYEFTSWGVSSGYATISPKQNFSIPFGLPERTAIYVGNFHFERQSGFGATVMGVKVSHHNQTQRDLGIAKTKIPSLASMEIELAVDTAPSMDSLYGGNSTSFDVPPIIFVR